MTMDIGLAMLTDMDDTTVFCIELAYRVVTGHTPVFAQSHDNLVL
jgi:hypothetical protein